MCARVVVELVLLVKEEDVEGWGLGLMVRERMER